MGIGDWGLGIGDWGLGITFNLKKVDSSVYDEKKNDKINKIFFSEIINNDKNNLEIYHFIMANENSDAGNFYIIFY